MCVTENTTYVMLFETFDEHCVTLQDFLVNICMAIAGVAMILLNGIVLHTLLAQKRDLDDPGNHFITNLAAADSLTGLFVIYDVCYNVLQYKQFTECVIRMGLFQSANTASVFTLAALTCDRYIKICYPYFYQRSITTRRVQFVCLGIWTLSIVVGLLPAFGWNYSNESDMCNYFAIMEFGYIRFSIILFYIPFLIMTVVYIRLVFLARKHSKSMSTMTRTSARGIWRSIKTASIIVGTYFVCWSPVGIFLLLVLETDLPMYLPLSANVIFTYLFGIGLINSLLNPIIYATKISFIKSRFREICCCARDTNRQRHLVGFVAIQPRSSRDMASTRAWSVPDGSLPGVTKREEVQNVTTADNSLSVQKVTQVNTE